MRDIFTKIGFFLLASLVLVQPLAADEWHFNDVDRIVAFSDVHGDYNAMLIHQIQTQTRFQKIKFQ